MYPLLRGRRWYIFIFRKRITAHSVRLLEKKHSRNSRDNTRITIRNADMEIRRSCLFGADMTLLSMILTQYLHCYSPRCSIAVRQPHMACRHTNDRVPLQAAVPEAWFTFSTFSQLRKLQRWAKRQHENTFIKDCS